MPMTKTQEARMNEAFEYGFVKEAYRCCEACGGRASQSARYWMSGYRAGLASAAGLVEAVEDLGSHATDCECYCMDHKGISNAALKEFKGEL